MNVSGFAPAPGQGETEPRPKAEPRVRRVRVTAIAATVPAVTADQETAEPFDSVVLPAG